MCRAQAHRLAPDSGTSFGREVVPEVWSSNLEHRGGRWHLPSDVDQAAFERLLARRLGRTVLLTSLLDWSAEEVIAGYSGQQRIERVFRGLKDGDWPRWGPMYHLTDSKIRVDAFYCLPGISLLQFLHQRATAVWPGLSIEQLPEELAQIQQVNLLYPPQVDQGPPRLATLLSKQTLTPQALAD